MGEDCEAVVKLQASNIHEHFLFQIFHTLLPSLVKDSQSCSIPHYPIPWMQGQTSLATVDLQQ